MHDIIILNQGREKYMSIFKSENYYRATASGMNFSQKKTFPVMEKVTYLTNPFGDSAVRNERKDLYAFPRQTDDWFTDYYVNECVDSIIDGKPGIVFNYKQLDLVVHIIAELCNTPDNIDIGDHHGDKWLKYKEYGVPVDCWNVFNPLSNKRCYVVAPKKNNLSLGDIRACIRRY